MTLKYRHKQLDSSKKYYTQVMPKEILRAARAMAGEQGSVDVQMSSENDWDGDFGLVDDEM